MGALYSKERMPTMKATLQNKSKLELKPHGTTQTNTYFSTANNSIILGVNGKAIIECDDDKHLGKTVLIARHFIETLNKIRSYERNIAPSAITGIPRIERLDEWEEIKFYHKNLRIIGDIINIIAGNITNLSNPTKSTLNLNYEFAIGRHNAKEPKLKNNRIKKIIDRWTKSFMVPIDVINIVLDYTDITSTSHLLNEMYRGICIGKEARTAFYIEELNYIMNEKEVLFKKYNVFDELKQSLDITKTIEKNMNIYPPFNPTSAINELSSPQKTIPNASEMDNNWMESIYGEDYKRYFTIRESNITVINIDISNLDEWDYQTLADIISECGESNNPRKDKDYIIHIIKYEWRLRKGTSISIINTETTINIQNNNYRPLQCERKRTNKRPITAYNYYGSNTNNEKYIDSFNIILTFNYININKHIVINTLPLNSINNNHKITKV